MVVKYTGWLTNGKQFDSSWDRDSTIDADLFSDSSGQQIRLSRAGKRVWSARPVGSQVLLVIPPDQAYGDKEQGPIPANSTLVFVIDILAAQQTKDSNFDEAVRQIQNSLRLSSSVPFISS